MPHALHRTQSVLYEMQAMAWKIATDRSGRRIGFMRPKEYDRLMKENKLEEHPDD